MITFNNIKDTQWRITGAQLADDLGDNPLYRPEFWSPHWGGGSNYRKATWADIESLARRWWDYHTRYAPPPDADGQVMRDIAYNYMAPPADGVSTEVLRLRGERSNGAHRNSNEWGPRTRTFVFPNGPGDPLPSDNQWEAFARMWEQDPLPVKYHRWFPGQNTECPGDDIVGLIEAQHWLNFLGLPDGVERVAGADRHETAIFLRRFVETLPPEQPPETIVFMATARNFPDALFAGPLVQTLLPIERDFIPPIVQDELRRIRPNRIVVIGGESVVSNITARALGEFIVP